MNRSNLPIYFRHVSEALAHSVHSNQQSTIHSNNSEVSCCVKRQNVINRELYLLVQSQQLITTLTAILPSMVTINECLRTAGVWLIKLKDKLNARTRRVSAIL